VEGMFGMAFPLRVVVAALVSLLASCSLHHVSDIERDVEVIITAVGEDLSPVDDVVGRAGGVVTHRLHLVDSIAARVPERALDWLADQPGIAYVSPNRPVRVQADPGVGVGPRSVHRQVVGADHLAVDGLTGRGVTVALVDTGVSPVADLDGRIRPVDDPLTGVSKPCVDFSGEGHCDDSYGHGTFMAGIIAGDGTASGGTWRGVAPGAEILSLKVAGADGSSDVAKVLAAIQWAVSFKDHHDIGVLNLSLGTDSTQSWDVDPFNYAVERAWHAGIVVTVAASNRGPGPGTISKPADDPWIITVGAVDDRGTPGLADDLLPDFTSRGPTAAGIPKPDVVAPGARIVSLRSPGSTIDTDFPSSLHHAYRSGSGTSMATAIVSGGVALLLEAAPARSPDQIKHALRSTAVPVAGGDPLAVGAGMVDLPAAVSHPAGTPELPEQRSSGLGSLDLARGSVTVTYAQEVSLLGALLTTNTILWDPIGFLTGDWRASTWPLTTWAGQEWPTTHWYGNNWHGNNWHGQWDDSDEQPIYGRPAAGAAWYGAWD
jgi:serine protease AprX